MTNTTKRVGTAVPRIRVPRGKVAPVSIVLAVQTVSLVALLFSYYVIAFFFAVRVVPFTMGFVKDGSGVTMDMPVDTVVAGWIAPSLFLLALLFGLAWITMRKLWQLRSRLVSHVRAWAFGLEDAPVTQIARAGAAKASRRSKSA